MQETEESDGQNRGEGDLDAMSAGQRAAATVGALLRQRHESLALAESCTGGLIAAALTDVAGSSDYIWGGAVVYSVAAKQTLLGLDGKSLDLHGTVSHETTAALAQGVRRISGATHGLAATGWAGPGGGTEDDPVGTVYLGLASADGTETRRCSFSGGRKEVREQAVVSALEWLQDNLAERKRAEDRATR